GVAAVATAAAVGPVHCISVVVTPPVQRTAAGTGDIFPFRFRRQAISFTTHLAEPAGIGTRVFPADIDYRTVVAAPAVVSGEGTIGGLCKQIVFIKADFILADGKWLADDNIMNSYTSAVILIPHQKTAYGNAHHFGAAQCAAKVADEVGAGRNHPPEDVAGLEGLFRNFYLLIACLTAWMTAFDILSDRFHH